MLVLKGGAYATHGEFLAGERATSKLLRGFDVDVAEVFASHLSRGSTRMNSDQSEAALQNPG